MTDREMLELAAKAAGIAGFWVDVGLNTGSDASPMIWNPLTDDGDALRLAVKLHMLVDADGEAYTVSTATPKGTGVHAYEKHKQDPYTATRRAIVHAAAEIGKAMP